MVTSHWLQTQRKPTTSLPPLLPKIFPITSYEWDMNNLSFQSQIVKEEKEKKENDTPRCEWDFSLSSVVSSNAVGSASDTLGVLEFDSSGSVLATGGIARKIRIYNFNTLISNKILDHNAACDYYICTPAKLSSLRWKPGSGQRIIGSGDYDGVVMEYDLEKRVPVFERDEHGGRRVWSVDYSQWDPVIGASGSDDGTMQMWDPRCDSGECIASVQPNLNRSSVCCVEFNPFNNNMVAVGCADRKAYVYDTRIMRDPVMMLDGHSKPVSYVRFLDRRMLVSAGTDGCLILWDAEDQNPVRTFRGHVNSKRFVGLSVWKQGGLLCCGSENNQVFVYDRRWGEPIWVHGFEEMGRVGCDPGFVSGVCWRQVGEDSCTLVAGGSDGVLQVFEGRRKLLLS